METIKKKELSPIVVAVGNKIKTIITEKNLRQRDVAYDAGLDVENLRKYIKGTQEMKITTMLKIVESLKINIEDLFS